MTRRPLRIATTQQLTRSAREAGFEVYTLPELPSYDLHRPPSERLSDGDIIRPFLEQHDIELLFDFNTEALTLQRNPSVPDELCLTNVALGIPYVACYLDPITSTMNRASWPDRWALLRSPSWIKWIWERAHAEELIRLGVPNVMTLPMAAANDDFNTGPLPMGSDGPIAAFMGHPATSWFTRAQALTSDVLFPGLIAAAVHADMPDLSFHKIYFDLYRLGEAPSPSDDASRQADLSMNYFNHKFAYNAYLALKQRDRFARFLKLKLGDAFELVGDFWSDHYGLPHTPRIWDMSTLHERMRRTPINLNLMKGSLETGLNIRHFEITAYGGFMLSYATAELSECFVIGEECDVFHNEEELLEKIHYYVEHDQRRREIAAAGQRRTMSEHLYSHRITRLVDILRQHGIISGGAPPTATVRATRSDLVAATVGDRGSI